jgi:hypothetical protein
VLVSCFTIDLAALFYWRGGRDILLGVQASNLVTGIFYSIVKLYAMFITMASFNKSNIFSGKITNSMEQNPSFKANVFSGNSQHFMEPKVSLRRSQEPESTSENIFYLLLG